MKTLAITMTVGMLCFITTPVLLHAAPVTWAVDATTVIDENDIDLTGTLVHAGTWGGTARSVSVGSETIVFEDRGVLPAGTTDGQVGANGENETFQNDAFIPTGPVDGEFEAVMDGFTFNAMPIGDILTVTFDALTVGASYQMQLFVSDDRSCCGGRTSQWRDQANGSGNNTTSTTHDASFFVIGLFTADATTQQVYMASSGANSNVFNAYALRQLAPPPLMGDLNNDGFVGLDDLDIILANWNQTVPPADPLADPNGDNFVGLDDLDIVLNNWNAGTPPPALGANIPEPATTAIMTLAASCLLIRHRHCG